MTEEGKVEGFLVRHAGLPLMVACVITLSAHDKRNHVPIISNRLLEQMSSYT